jgi:hypothetical protein
MKKIFYFIASAVVALGATACQNDINDTVTPDQQGESVSISVTIADQTRVSLGDFEEGKGYKLSFEEGDQLYIVTGWADSTEEGYYFDYTKQEDDTYVFTCTADGVSGIVGDWKGVYYLGGRKNAVGAYGNTAEESLKGVFMKGAGEIGGSTPISLEVAPVLKLKSDYPVTITASNWIFCNGTKSYTTQKTGEWIYLAANTDGTYTLTATIKGQPAVVKSSGKVTGELTLAMEYNKIYNLGELDVMPKESVDGDVNVAIAIDGAFADWDAVTKNVATLPADATSNVICKTLKVCADANNIYGYMEVAVEDSVKFIMTLDLDNDPTTGSHNWMLPNVNGELLISSCTLCDAGAPYSAPFRWGGYSVGSHEIVNSSSATTIADGLVAVEFAIARESINSLITGPNAGIGVATYGTSGQPSGIMPYDGNALVFPVPAAE